MKYSIRFSGFVISVCTSLRYDTSCQRAMSSLKQADSVLPWQSFTKHRNLKSKESCCVMGYLFVGLFVSALTCRIIYLAKGIVFSAVTMKDLSIYLQYRQTTYTVAVALCEKQSP